jgi:hypothetical protein
LLHGLLLKDPSERISLRSFRHDRVVRHPERCLAQPKVSDQQVTLRNPLSEDLLPNDDNSRTELDDIADTSNSSNWSAADGSGRLQQSASPVRVHVTPEDVAEAIMHCNVVLSARAQKVVTIPPTSVRVDGEGDVTAPGSMGANVQVGLSQFVQRLRSKALDARLLAE